MKKLRKFSLSPSTLNIYVNCPRCFWFHMVKGAEFKRPEGPTSTLPRGMDNLIKIYFDTYRAKCALPPEIEAEVTGQLIEESLIHRWRNWKTGLQFIDSDGSRLFGALDECLVCDGMYIPVDYKTRGYDLKEDSTSYYILQMSSYNFLLARNGYAVSEHAYLVFYIPSKVSDEGLVHFKIEVKKVETFPLDKVHRTFRQAVELLSLNEPPPKNNGCKFCNWAQKVAHSQESQLHLF
ncbi:MAG: PD-(D/E)XK nuclease family protein [Candidatus Omnitrophota bacterium]|nr:MAG: PD-(D/E)XK nuclease family protein [Candidatus Omnitrophota bacterium]